MTVFEAIIAASAATVAVSGVYATWHITKAAKSITHSVGAATLAFSEFAWPLGGLIYDLGNVSGPFTEWVERELEKEGIYGFDDDDDLPPPASEDDDMPPGPLQ